MQIQYMRFFKNTRIALVMILTLIGVGCVSHPLVPDETRGKTFAVYPASIALTVKEKVHLTKELVKDVSIFVVTAVATGGYFVVTPKPEPGREVASWNLGPPLMNEFAIKFEPEFGMHKAADHAPLSSSKSTGGLLTKAEVKGDYQNVADYLVQLDHASNEFVGAFRLFYEARTNNYFIRYLVTANIYDAKTGERLDWAVCNGEHGSATLANWFKDNGKLLADGTQEVATKCADEMIRKFNKATKS